MESDRRKFLASAGAAFTTSIFTGRVQGANDRIAVGFIGVGRQGNSNMNAAMREPSAQVAAICDVYQPNLEVTVATAKRNGHDPKTYKDFRGVLADKSIDAVLIATPDHWHALMTVEACKAGKDVYVEKPVCTYVDEAPKMVQAAQKYKRVVQAGTQSRSLGHMPAIQEVIKSGQLGKITFVRVKNYELEAETGIGNPADSTPPEGLDWNMWLGPAPYHAYNTNRFHQMYDGWSRFRAYWDYSNGQIGDNGIHIIDLMQMSFMENAPTVVTALGGKTYLKDSRETPDTICVLYQYPEFIMAYEMRYGNAQSFGIPAIAIHGSKGTMTFGLSSSYSIYAERDTTQAATPAEWKVGAPFAGIGGAGGGARGGQAAPAAAPTAGRGGGGGAPAEALKPTEQKTFQPTQSHWGNFLECIRTRQRPIGDIEYVARSSVTALLGNVAMRSKVRVDYDPKTWTSPQKEARAFMAYKYRAPWKLEV
jgi:predicted dehydrogenase